MRKTILYIPVILLLAACQHQLHFPAAPVVPIVSIPPEKVITAVVITDPTQTDYDSLVFRYGIDTTREVHYSRYGDSVIRSYYYDGAGRLSGLEDEKAIYYTNNNRAKRIRFLYDAGGLLQQTQTDFAGPQGIPAYIINNRASASRQMIVYDTSYTTTAYNLDWANRIIYSTVSNSNYILYDSAIFSNTTTAGLVKTIANAYQYGADSTLTSIDKHIYFNGQLAEYGIVLVTIDHAAPVYSALRKKLFRNLSNWFEAGMVWQDDNYRLFPLPSGPCLSILYKGYSTGGEQPYTRNYEFNNSYGGDQLNKSVVAYSLEGQGSNHYTNVLRYYYR